LTTRKQPSSVTSPELKNNELKQEKSHNTLTATSQGDRETCSRSNQQIVQHADNDNTANVAKKNSVLINCAYKSSKGVKGQMEGNNKQHDRTATRQGVH